MVRLDAAKVSQLSENYDKKSSSPTIHLLQYQKCLESNSCSKVQRSFVFRTFIYHDRRSSLICKIFVRPQVLCAAS